MRPTITEQLRETRRILKEAIEPAIGDDYARQILRKLIANLDVVERAWPNVASFLYWDNERMTALLGAIEVGATLRAEVEALEKTPCGAVLDVVTLHQRNDVLNGLVLRAVVECPASDRRRIQAHLLERTARYPFRPIKED